MFVRSPEEMHTAASAPAGPAAEVDSRLAVRIRCSAGGSPGERSRGDQWTVPAAMETCLAARPPGPPREPREQARRKGLAAALACSF